MVRTAITSSNIAALGYNPQTLELEVEFKNGGIFCYTEVPQEAADKFIKTPEDDSHGKHFARHIKNRYASTRIN